MPDKKDTPAQDPTTQPAQEPTPAEAPAQDPNAQPVPPQTPPSVDGTQPVQPVPEYRKLDETVPGGKYTTADGRTVNANNEPIKE